MTDMTDMTDMSDKKQRKFRLLRSNHIEREWQDWKPGDPETDTRTITIYRGDEPVKVKQRLVKHHYTIGDIVETDIDLVALHGREKFQEVDGENIYVPQPDISDKLLGRMTVAQLREHAEAEEIDLTGAELKADIIKRIREYSEETTAV